MGYRLLIVVLLAATLAYLVLARDIPLDPWNAEELVNSRTLPTVYGSLMTAVLTVLLFRPPPGARYPRHARQALALTGLLAGFIGVLPLVGVWPALAALLLTAQLVMGERRPLPLLMLPLSLPVGGWLLVERWLGVYVPGMGV